jgi:hypothetical protein
MVTAGWLYNLGGPAFPDDGTVISGLGGSDI